METKYQQRKQAAREKAINYQNNYNLSLSWLEVAQITTYFYKLGRRYGLVKEFRENGII